MDWTQGRRLDAQTGARAAVRRYARAMALPEAALPTLFAFYWIDYALEKVDALGRAGGSADVAAAAGKLRVWTLARFEGGTCLNLKLLAERERSTVVS